jgi:glycosyltransferase involved in cell wall biosynthesis
MKRIILDCDLMRFPHSGLYHYCLNLGMSVSELLNDDERMKFYTPPREKEAFGDGNRTIPEKKWHKFAKPFLWNCDIWHAPFQSGRIIPNRRRHPNVKVLLTIHDLNPLHEGKPVEEQRKSLAHTQSLIDRSDAIVCISDFCRTDVLRHCNVKNKPIYVIHNGTHKVHTPKLNTSSYKPVRPFLFGMGYINTKKNYHVLLPLLKDESIELVVAGKLDEPDYIDNMKKQANTMGVADRLHILGPVTEGEKGWYFENCMAFVHPSLAEGFGAPVVEVMQFGKPLFLSSLTSLPEIGGQDAFYFSSFDGDHMQEVFYTGMQRYQRGNMSEALKKRGMMFDWKQKAREYLEVYRSLY